MYKRQLYGVAKYICLLSHNYTSYVTSRTVDDLRTLQRASSFLCHQPQVDDLRTPQRASSLHAVIDYRLHGTEAEYNIKNTDILLTAP